MGWAETNSAVDPQYKTGGATNFNLTKQTTLYAVWTDVPRLYGAGFSDADALLLETASRSFYKKLSQSTYGSVYGGYARVGSNWATILFSNREEAVQWLGVNVDGTTVNNPQSNKGANKLTHAGQDYYYSTAEGQIASSFPITGPEDKAYFGMLADMAAAARYMIDNVPQYAITYDANGGTGAELPDGHKKLAGLSFAILAFPLAKVIGDTSVAITGWNTSPDGSGRAFDLGGMVNSDGAVSVVAMFTLDEPGGTTLYAQYDNSKVTVTLDLDGGTFGAVSVLAARGKLMPVLGGVPLKADNVFAGYFDDDGVQYYLNDGPPARI